MAIGSVIVMGVSGSGKSTLGAKLAQRLGAKFIDGDDLHPRTNIEKMATGKPLDDHDRTPWLGRISDAAFSLEHKHEYGVIVCSALKRLFVFGRRLCVDPRKASSAQRAFYENPYAG